mgnify:FL=1|jgi:hypothetical protein
MKYNEERIIEEISRYIKGTYGEHYSTTKDGFQVQDMLRHLNIDKDFCQANAIKYLCRYGKKSGKNRKDLLKAIHYIVLLMSSEDKDNKTSTDTGDIEAFNGS